MVWTVASPCHVDLRTICQNAPTADALETKLASYRCRAWATVCLCSAAAEKDTFFCLQLSEIPKSSRHRQQRLYSYGFRYPVTLAFSEHPDIDSKRGFATELSAIANSEGSEPLLVNSRRFPIVHGDIDSKGSKPSLVNSRRIPDQNKASLLRHFSR